MSSRPPRLLRLAGRFAAPADVSLPTFALLWFAASGVGVAGYLHGHLYHEGYAHVWVVGPLFLLNAVGSGLVIVTLLLRRVALFAAGALGISLGSVVSILISHTTSFFGFAEGAYGWRASTIVVAETVAAVATILAMALARSRMLPSPDARARSTGGRFGAGPIAQATAGLVLVATVLVAVGVGQGSPPPEPQVSAAAQAHEVTALSHVTGQIAQGRGLFSSDGCADCHTLAAGRYGGQLGPRLDAGPLPAAAVQAIVDSPPHSIPGFQTDLMPRNFARRLPARDVRAIAAFVAAASGAAASSSG
jgi:mono/diheme cytochrome c family protein